VSASSMRVRVVMSCSARSGTIAELRCGCTWSSTPTGVPRSSGAFTGRRGEGDCSRRETLRGGALYRVAGVWAPRAALGACACALLGTHRTSGRLAPEAREMATRPQWLGRRRGPELSHTRTPTVKTLGLGRRGFPSARGDPLRADSARQFGAPPLHRALRGCPGMLSRTGTGRRWPAERRSAGACATGSYYGLTGSGPPPAQLDPADSTRAGAQQEEPRQTPCASRASPARPQLAAGEGASQRSGMGMSRIRAGSRRSYLLPVCRLRGVKGSRIPQ
jgi:hypothetical protein